MDDPGMDMDRLLGTRSQAQIDEEHLRLLTLFHSIVGGIIAAFASIFIFHIIMGLTLIAHPNAFPTAPGSPPFPRGFGYLFVALGAAAVLGGWALGALTIVAGRCIKARRHYIFILVVAGLDCLFVMPLGTILGVFTFVVLSRPSVKALFPP